MKSPARKAGRSGGSLDASLDGDTPRDSRAAPIIQALRAPALRPYQAQVIANLQSEVAAGRKRLVLVAPTGSGKTVIAAEIVRGAIERELRVLFLAHRRELIEQAHAKLFDLGLDAGIILAGHASRPDERVQIASIQTLWARAMQRRLIELPPADLVVVDEAHHCRAKTYRKIVGSYSDAVILGLTATPCRGDGRGLGNVFEAIVECPPVQDLIGLGFLVPTRVYAPMRPDLVGVSTARGDYVEKDLAERVDRPELVGGIVEHWLRLAERRRTVVFATSVAHSVHLRDEFRRAGVLAEHLDGATPLVEREAILRRLDRGEVEVVTNCMVLCEGWDQPAASCLVLARPTKNHGLFRQMVGRVLRPAPGKIDALVLDHAGATFTHGFAEEPVKWTLVEDKRAELPAQASRASGRKRALTTCPECHAVRIEGKPCGQCGWRPVAKPLPVEVADGELGLIDRALRVRNHQWTADEKARFHRQLLWVARERGYKAGWAAHKHKEKFGHWPDESFATPEPPDEALRSWVRSRAIAYAKAMERRGAA